MSTLPSANIDGSTTPPAAPPASPPAAAPASPPDAPASPPASTETVPLATLTAVRKRAQDAEAALAKRDAADVAAKAKAAEEQGEYQRLYEGTKSKAAAYDKHVEAVSGRNATALEALAPEWRAAVPQVLLDAPLALAQWLTDTKSLREKEAKEEATRPAGARAGGGGPTDETIPEAAKADALKAGKTPEEWWSIMKHSSRYKPTT